MRRQSKDQNTTQENIAQLPKTTEQGTLALFPYTPCVHLGDYQVKIHMRFGLTEQQHEINTDKHPEITSKSLTEIKLHVLPKESKR